MDCIICEWSPCSMYFLWYFGASGGVCMLVNRHQLIVEAASPRGVVGNIRNWDTVLLLKRTLRALFLKKLWPADAFQFAVHFIFCAFVLCCTFLSSFLRCIFFDVMCIDTIKMWPSDRSSILYSSVQSCLEKITIWPDCFRKASLPRQMLYLPHYWKLGHRESAAWRKNCQSCWI